MPDAIKCQRCGLAIGPDAAQGLCPACLLEEALRHSQAPENPLDAVANPAPDLSELARLFPQLEVLQLIGRGGMGVVYKARHRGLDRLVALKILPPGIDRDRGFQERFVREARALARLNHPHIVAIYDFGQVEGRYYFMMEFVDGATLRSMLQAGHLTPQAAMAIVPQLCDALQFAHEEGIVHRDIKPENILLDKKGRVKIADFGLAKLLNGSLQQDPYTLTGHRQILGTPHYMAPEQFERPATVDHRADIYSMGVVFYEMLTGELPLGRFQPPSRKVQVDVRLDEVVLRTLEKEPDLRFQRASEVKTELTSLASLPSGGGPPTWNAKYAAAGPVNATAFAGEPSRISPLALAGLIVALFFPVIMWVLMASNDAVLAQHTPSATLTLIFPLLLCAIGSCGLGAAALRQIRTSSSRFHGLKLALVDLLLYPLLLLDGIIFSSVIFLVRSEVTAQPPESIIALTCLFIGALYLWIILATRSRFVRTISPNPSRPQKTGVPGVLLATGAAALLAIIIILWIRVLDSRTAQAQLTKQATVRADVLSDADPASGVHTYRFEVHSPENTKVTVWAEVWKKGTLDLNPGFAATQWLIPANGQAFDELVTFNLGPSEEGHIKVGWQFQGNAGTTLTSQTISDPFDNLPVRDSTWGIWTGSWSISPGNQLPLLVLRGGKDRIIGAPDDANLAGQADAEIR